MVTLADFPPLRAGSPARAFGGAAGVILLIALGLLTGCSPALETDQARLCRMALPALMPKDARITIRAQTPDADGRGLTVAFAAETPGGEPRLHAAACRFRAPGRPRASRDLTSLTLDGRPLSDTELLILIRYWLATTEGRMSDPEPLGDVTGLPVLPHGFAYGLQMALDGLPLATIYALLAAAYSLI
jgi:branched-chain amino acid transport system permease protein